MNLKTLAVAGVCAFALAQGAFATEPLGYSSAQGNLTLNQLDQIQHWRFLKRFDGPLFEDVTKDKPEVQQLMAQADRLLPGNMEDLPPPASTGCTMDLAQLRQLEHWLWFRSAEAPVFQQASAKHAEVKSMIAHAESCWCGSNGAVEGTAVGGGAVLGERRRGHQPVRLGKVTTEEIVEVRKLVDIQQRNPRLYEQILQQQPELREVVTRVEQDEIWPRVRTLTVEQITEIEYLADLRVSDPAVFERVITEDTALAGFYRGFEPVLVLPGATAPGVLPAGLSLLRGERMVAPGGAAVVPGGAAVVPGGTAVTPAGTAVTPAGTAANANAANANAATPQALNANAVNANAANANAANANAANASAANANAANASAAKAPEANANAANANASSAKAAKAQAPDTKAANANASNANDRSSSGSRRSRRSRGANANGSGAKANGSGANANESGANAKESGAKANGSGANANDSGANADESGANASSSEGRRSRSRRTSSPDSGDANASSSNAPGDAANAEESAAPAAHRTRPESGEGSGANASGAPVNSNTHESSTSGETRRSNDSGAESPASSPAASRSTESDSEASPSRRTRSESPDTGDAAPAEGRHERHTAGAEGAAPAADSGAPRHRRGSNDNASNEP